MLIFTKNLTVLKSVLEIVQKFAITNETASNQTTTFNKVVEDKKSEIETLFRIKKHGVQFSGSIAKGERVFDAVGMIAEVAINDEIVRNDFDDVDFFERKVCCGDYDSEGNFHINAYEGDPDFTQDGTNGEVWYEQKPFYWNGSYDGLVSVCGTKIKGYELAPLFKNSHDYVYLPCYWMATIENKATSRSGTFADINSQINHMTKAKTYNANGHTETMKAHMTEYILQLVEFATKDLQSIMNGCCYGVYSNSYKALSDETNSNKIVLTESQANQFRVGQTICIGTSAGNYSKAKDRIITEITAGNVLFDGEPVEVTTGNVIWNRTWKNGATDIIKASSGSPRSNTNGKYPCLWRGKVDP